MQTISLKTTVDITATNPTRDEKDPILIAQQGNFNSLIQGIGMRANIYYEFNPMVTTEASVKYWNWAFKVEQQGIWQVGTDQLALLNSDLDGIPIIGTLTNTTDIKPAVFCTSGERQNIWLSVAIF